MKSIFFGGLAAAALASIGGRGFAVSETQAEAEARAAGAKDGARVVMKHGSEISFAGAPLVQRVVTSPAKKSGFMLPFRRPDEPVTYTPKRTKRGQRRAAAKARAAL